MEKDLIVLDTPCTISDATRSTLALPEIIIQAGPEIANRFVEFFLVSIRNPNTRSAYGQAVSQFLIWCKSRHLQFNQITPIAVSAYIEQHAGSPQTKNQHLSAIRRLFGWMKQGGILQSNPAEEVQGIKHRVKTGKTPTLSDEEMRELLSNIDVSSVVGLRDRALIAVMFFSFARVSAVVGMTVSDYYQKQKRWWLRLHEKGGKFHEVPCHHTVEAYLDAYIEAGNLQEEKDSPLFRTTRGRSQKLTRKPLSRKDAWAMIKRRARKAGVNPEACNHSFRASGITNYLNHGGSRDNAQKIAAHEDVRTTALYDRREDDISLDEIERIRL